MEVKLNPYENIDWENIEQIHSCSHMHVTTQSRFDWATGDGGFRHIASSDYSPSVPWYPLSSHYSDIPADVIGSPNSEKVNTNNSGGHFNALGSFNETPGHDWDEEEDGPYPSWQDAFDDIIDELQYSDAGGITLNHPNDTDLDDRLKMLAHHESVLGIEIFSQLADDDNYYDGYSYDNWVPFWDEILRAGQRCWGFGIVDHMTTDSGPPWRGRNVLLLDDVTEYEALKAYREGRFFASTASNSSGLKFTKITLSETALEVETNNAVEIRFITNNGIEKTIHSDSANFSTLESREYVRVEAVDSDGEMIFSQPIMFEQDDVELYLAAGII